MTLQSHRRAPAQVDSYDWHSNAWRAEPPLARARWGAAAAVVDGRIFVSGGSNGNATLASVESFDPREGVRSRAAAAAPARGRGWQPQAFLRARPRGAMEQPASGLALTAHEGGGAGLARRASAAYGAVPARERGAWRTRAGAPPPPPPFVLIGHAASFTPY